MSPLDKTAPSQTSTVTFEVELPHPPAKVWRALTEPRLLSQWLLPVFGLELRVGAPFTLKTQPYPPWDGVVSCKVLELVEQKKLRFAWAVGGMGLDTEVTFTLTPTATGTHLLLEQAGFKPEQKQNWGGARYGWKTMAQKLVDLLGRSAE